MRLTPLLDPDFAALMAPFAPFEDKPVLAVAVSGGRDSLALTLLADAWARARAGRVVGLVVDHGLRPESAAEAQGVRESLAGHGIEAEILRWTGDKPARGLQEAARAARYRLLLDACRRRDVLHLLVAHHADDQAETVTMRAARDSGPDGLAGMAALVEYPEARLLRPLLGVPRERLTATLTARGVAWIEDPSNADPRFERVRVRQLGAPARPSAEAARRRQEQEPALARAAVELLQIDEAGRVCFDPVQWQGLDIDLRHRVLSRLVRGLSGAEHPPRRARLAQAAERLSRPGERGKSGKGQDFTLFGCRLVLRRERTRGRAGGRMLWIVSPESGRNDRKKGAQPLIPAGFFACGAPGAHHVVSQPLSRT
jgi:tRNA(Ile)-lysidine synthase